MSDQKMMTKLNEIARGLKDLNAKVDAMTYQHNTLPDTDREWLEEVDVYLEERDDKFKTFFSKMFEKWRKESG